MIVKLLIISVLLVGIAFLGLGFNIIFRKGKDFPETEVGKNKNMMALGIHCIKCEEIKQYRKMKRLKIDPKKLKISY